MTRTFDGQVVWITGGGSGIGRALAVELAGRGAKVAVSGRRRDRLTEVVEALEAAGHTAIAVPCDVTVDAQVEAAVCTIVDRLGRLDVAIANAGYAASGRVEEAPMDVWRRQLDTNVLGVVSTARHALPELRRTKGRLVLMGSVAAYVGLAGQGPYVVSKAAIAALGATLATEVAGSGVAITVVHPGFVTSDIVQVDDHGRFVGGRKDRRPKALTWSAERAAAAIADATAARQREVVLTAYGKAAVSLSRHAPGVLQALLTARAPRSEPPPRDDELGVMPLTPVAELALASPPGPGALVPSVLRAARRKPQGVLEEGRTFPALRARVRGVVVPAARVARYREVCGMPGDPAVLPLPLPETLFFGVLGTLATHPSFPLSPLGLIHIGQTLTGHAPLHADQPLDLTAELAEVRRTPKGFELDVRMTAGAGEREAWEAVATLLSRRPGLQPARKGARPTPLEPTALLEVPEPTGRDYAAVSDDWNPHHLWSWTARPLGYRRPIAHGMWSLARLLGQVSPSVDTTVGHATARFLKPILLPGRIAVRVAATNGTWSLDAWDPDKGSTHVAGSFVPHTPAPTR